MTEVLESGTARHETPEVSTLDVFGYLEALPQTLTEKERLAHYQILQPALANLWETDSVAFDLATRQAAKKLGVTLRYIRKDIAGMLPPAQEEGGEYVQASSAHGQERGPSQATQLVDLAADAELFHTPDGEAWATICVEGHCEHWLLKNKSFRRWLARRYYNEEQKAPGSQAVQDALGVLEGRALFDGAEHLIFTRVAESRGAIYIDLCNDAWEAIEITAHGWQVIANPPVRFRRMKGMLPLPHPVAGGTLRDLQHFVNIQNMDAWVLLIAWLLMTFSPRGPYPVLDLAGEQGSAKSTLARVLRSLVDPSSAPLRTSPREERDLTISAHAGWILAFDNLSFLPQWLSDAFCRLATGGGFATRELYTDSEEVLFDAQLPVLFTAIEDIASQGDLIDRSIRLLLPAVPKQKRKRESVFWSEFEAARPKIFGALLDVVAAAHRNLPTVKLENLPRMADFAAWVIAAEPALGWNSGTFLEVYARNRQAANDLALDASLVAGAVKKLMEKGPWEGTASELLEVLTAEISEKDAKAKTWPKSPLSLANVLRRLAPNLRAADIGVTFLKTTNNNSKRLIRIETPPSDASVADPDFTEESSDAGPEGATLKKSSKIKASGDSDDSGAPLQAYSNHGQEEGEL